MIIQRNNDLNTALLDEQICIFEPVKANYLTLNKVGSFIWSKIENPLILDDLFAIILANYDCKKNEIKSEVYSFINEAIRLNLIKEVDS